MFSCFEIYFKVINFFIIFRSSEILCPSVKSVSQTMRSLRVTGCNNRVYWRYHVVKIKSGKVAQKHVPIHLRAKIFWMGEFAPMSKRQNRCVFVKMDMFYWTGNVFTPMNVPQILAPFPTGPIGQPARYPVDWESDRKPEFVWDPERVNQPPFCTGRPIARLADVV